MRKVKHLAAILLIAVMAVSVFAGCGTTSTTTTGATTAAPTTTKATTGATTTAAPTETTKGERLTISVIGIDWGYGPSADSTMEQWWEDLFDVNFEIEWVNYNDYHQKINTMIAADSVPDVAQIYKMAGAYYYPIFTEAIDAGKFLDMTDHIFGAEGLATTNATMSKWSQSMWDQATYNSGIYILPRSKSEIAIQSGLNVRKDLMVKYGFEEEPKTMDELQTWLIGLADAATAGEGSKIYALDFYGDFMSDRAKAFAVAYTGQMDWGINAAGDYEYIQFNDKYIDFLDWMKGLFDANVLDPEFALGNADTSKWKGGKSVGFLTAWYNWNQSADRTSNKIFDESTPESYEAWCLMPFQGPATYAVSANSSDIDAAIAVNSKVSAEKAAKIMEAFNGTEEAYPGYNDVMANGVEGLHYELKADGTKDSSKFGEARTAGYVGAWNQIFLKIDADQVTAKFMREGARRASDASIARAQEIKAFLAGYLEDTGLRYANMNLVSKTYNSNWSTLVSDVDDWCTQYVMGVMTRDEYLANINNIKNSDIYKAIQAEYKAAAGN